MTVRIRLASALLLWMFLAAPASAQMRSIQDELYTYVLGIEGKTHDERAAYIKAQLKRIMVPFLSVPFSGHAVHGTDSTRVQGENIIVRLGRGPRKILVGAHYDAVPGSPGANDNGGGVSVLLALARALRHHEWNYSVELVFFDREEAGLAGSRFYARTFVDASTHLAMINLDVVGTGDVLLAGPVGGGDDAVLMPLLRSSATTRGAALHETADYPESDHVAFEERRLENISLSMAPKGDVEKIERMVRGEVRSMNDIPSIIRVMHTPNDTSDEVSPDALRTCFEVTQELLLQLNQYR